MYHILERKTIPSFPELPMRRLAHAETNTELNDWILSQSLGGHMGNDFR